MACEQTDPEKREPKFRTRLEVVFATEAAKAVILRRGPKRHFNLITWDLETDTFESGQWMKGIVRLCDLSPSGDRLIYWAAQYHASAPRDLQRPRAASDPLQPYDPLHAGQRSQALPKKYKKRKVPAYMRQDSLYGKRAGSANPIRWGGRPPRQNQGVWTAISRPPYFSALAIWPAFGHWTGGGLFRSDDEVILMESEDGMTPVENVRIPSGVRVQSFDEARKTGRLPKAWLKQTEQRGGEGEQEQLLSVVNSLRAAGVRWVDWVYPHASEDLLFACDGCVHRLSDWKAARDGEHLRKAFLLADFTELQFRQIRPPPEAMKW